MTRSSRELIWCLLICGGVFFVLFVLFLVDELTKDKPHKRMSTTQYSLRMSKSEIALYLFCAAVFFGFAVFAGVYKLKTSNLGAFLWLKVLPVVFGVVTGMVSVAIAIYYMKWKVEVHNERITLSRLFHSDEVFSFCNIASVRTVWRRYVVFVNDKKWFSVMQSISGADIFLKQIKSSLLERQYNNL